MTEKEQWYTNKDLFEMFQELRIDIQTMSQELKQTREIVSKYNSLRKRLDAIELKAMGRSSVGRAIREWGGWLIAIFSCLFSLVKLGVL